MNPLNFKKVLIANRGEIALRIMRSLRELGIESIAVYSDADAQSQHRFFADWAVRLPGRTSAETYLNIPKIIEAVQTSGADAVHPGFGFLSENADFVDAVQSSTSAKFIGPSSDAMRKMGDKISARRIMKKAGVAIVPGSLDALQSVDEAVALCNDIGLPVILKAAAGGGGRGMKIVHEKSELPEAFEQCQREAVSYFGNGDIFCERYIQSGRHIEFQVLGDGKGNAIHLFERDCSVQRRHQKLIEEAPSVFLDEAHRTRLGSMAIKAAEAVNYEGAGTVEMICESPDKSYFMEMNTRIQVEHPITEMITGIDLIAEQIRICEGKGISVKQEQLVPHGFAVECRINAEDPDQDFMPSADVIQNLHLPSGPFTRVDTHVYEGYDIPKEYDSMIAKIITWGLTREDALRRQERALSELRIGGVRTNASFQQRIIRNAQFRSGEFTTGFIEDQSELLFNNSDSESLMSDQNLKILGAAIEIGEAQNQKGYA